MTEDPAPQETFTLYDGSRMSVLERPSGPDDSLVMQFVLEPDCGAPPPHVHPNAVEIFEVETGEFEMLVGDEWRKVGAGEKVEVPPGLRHTFRNRSGAAVVIRNIHDPHHDFESYIRAIAAFSHEIESTSPDSPRAAMRMAMLWRRHSDLIRPADPPLKLLFPLLSGVGRLTGAKLPEPGTG